MSHGRDSYRKAIYLLNPRKLEYNLMIMDEDYLIVTTQTGSSTISAGLCYQLYLLHLQITLKKVFHS